MNRIEVKPLSETPEAEDFARMLRTMYEAWNGRVDYEPGVHSLTYVSPFDPKSRRHTVFVEVVLGGCHAFEREAIRRYVLDPYTLVRDYRLRRETEDVRAVLAGDLAKVFEGEKFELPPPTLLRELSPADVQEAKKALDEMRDEHGRLPWERDDDTSG